VALQESLNKSWRGCTEHTGTRENHEWHKGRGHSNYPP
jgi:hypothetical protein